MSKCKLILLEGIPGSGKSTVGIQLRHFLEDRGFSAHFWHEGDFDNPADFEAVACLNRAEYQRFLSCYPELAELFEEYSIVQGDDHLLSYRKLQRARPHEMPPTLLDELSRYDVYDGLPMDDYCRLALQRWRDFQRSAINSDQITLLECCFLQNPLTVMLARHNADTRLVRQHIIEITSIIQNLNPLVIYLCPQNVRSALEHVRAERPKEWADFVIWYLTGQAYGQAHHLDGFEGVIQFYEIRQKLELDILKSLPIRSLVIEYSGGDWDRCEHEIENFVSSDLAG